MESHFVDYFAICGLDTKGGLELEHFTSSYDIFKILPKFCLKFILLGKNQGPSASTPLERSYVAKLLAHYPNNRSDQPFSQEILAVSFCAYKS